VLYASRLHGFSNAAFHQRCDAQAPTLNLVRLRTGHLFGGYYASAPWASNPWVAEPMGGMRDGGKEGTRGEWTREEEGNVAGAHSHTGVHARGRCCAPGATKTFEGLTITAEG